MVSVTSFKTFAVFGFAIFSGLILLGGMRAIWNPIPASIERDDAALFGYLGITAVTIAIGLAGLSWSLWWIRRNMKQNQTP
jgi:hypothetical protein